MPGSFAVSASFYARGFSLYPLEDRPGSLTVGVPMEHRAIEIETAGNNLVLSTISVQTREDSL
jgi:hypothetical protein